MTQLIVISAIGRDRPGVVEAVSSCILKGGGSIQESRMARLGQEFAMLVLVGGNWATQSKLTSALDKLAADEDLSISVRPTDASADSAQRLPYAVDVISLDQDGIVFELSRFMASRNIDISEVSTRAYRAAHTGAPMFAVQMNIGIPAETSVARLREEFLEVCDHMNLDALIEPIKP